MKRSTSWWTGSRPALSVRRPPCSEWAPNRWLHWGTTTTYNGRLDFPYHESVLGFQSATLANLLNPFRLGQNPRWRDQIGAADHGDHSGDDGSADSGDLTESWGPGADHLGGARDLQRAYLDQMTQLVVQPPDDRRRRRSVARMQPGISSTARIRRGRRRGARHLPASASRGIEARIQKALSRDWRQTGF